VLLAPVMSGFAIGAGGSMADQKWFGWTLTWMDLCCFSNSFIPLFCDGDRRWSKCYEQGLAYWSGAW
jgi:hypothetical protein